MFALIQHLARRGLEAASLNLDSPNDNGHGGARRLSAWALLVFIVTTIVFGLVAFAFQYTYGMVVAMLTVVEDPHPDIYTPITIPDSSSKSPINNTSSSLDTTAFSPPGPITRSLRTAILHLRARAGPWSRFRGLNVYLCMGICRTLLAKLFLSSHHRNPDPLQSLILIATDVVSAPLELAWVHIVVSKPSERPFWRRIPGCSSWVKIAPAVALRSAASQLTLDLPAQLGLRLIQWPVNQGNSSFSDPEYNPNSDILIALGVLVLSWALVVLVEIPATVTMIRVAASLLPKEEETIVPFDRTFGGKVQPVILGGSGKIGLLDAWRTFTWPSRIRLLKVLAKTFAMLTAVALTCAVFLAGEVMLFGDKLIVKV
ncbi:hypothetical protein PAAG_03453 [Paracoccidioides lutzii Pb01]|uniref:Ubiquitin conjugating enzyme n=1 Tax=Paracoccidioides lutzii (strain ATCC MYA-826 / Pb01) TaxID=502779 RepID=C1GX79_PARBA|nr:hypothetical protein PAAG_03453 [Paracoccidioides lutzii Pb01]EEH41167.1 hypothetical protein PAAG_03453 [Paracoccidioides lutzii Pb01]